MKLFYALIASASFLLLTPANAKAEGSTLTAEAPIQLNGVAGKFDFMASDEKLHRVLAAHTAAKTVEVLDTQSGKVIATLPSGEAQGVAIDDKGARYFFGDDGEHSVVIFDSQKLTKLGEIKVDGPVDDVTYDSKDNRVFAAKDNGDKLWVIDPDTKKQIGTVALPGSPEVMSYDASSGKIYLAIKNKNEVVQIDPLKLQIEQTWPTAPATSPHGLVVDSARSRVYTAGGNGKLVALDLKTGKVVSSADIPVKVDQIAYDKGNETIYSACRDQVASTSVSNDGLKAIGTIKTAVGVHTLAVDPATHSVWVSYADTKHSYLQRLKHE